MQTGLGKNKEIKSAIPYDDYGKALPGSTLLRNSQRQNENQAMVAEGIKSRKKLRKILRAERKVERAKKGNLSSASEEL